MIMKGFVSTKLVLLSDLKLRMMKRQNLRKNILHFPIYTKIMSADMKEG